MTIRKSLTVAVCSFALTVPTVFAQSLGDVARATREKKAAESGDSSSPKTFSNLDDPPKPDTATGSNSSQLPTMAATMAVPSGILLACQKFATTPPATEAERKRAEICPAYDMPLDAAYEFLAQRGVAVRDELCSRNATAGSPLPGPEMMAKITELQDIRKAFYDLERIRQNEKSPIEAELRKLNQDKLDRMARVLPGYPGNGQHLTDDQKSEIKKINESFADQAALLQDKEQQINAFLDKWRSDLNRMDGNCRVPQ